MQRATFLVYSSIACILLNSNRTLAQILPTPNDTNTQVNAQGTQFNISGGQQAGTNLFHSFQQFDLSTGQTANFQSNSTIQNILSRITGGNPSTIDGLLKVTGGNSNLYLMNPAGILFGPNASLNLPAAFTVTTAQGIGLGDRLFRAWGSNDYSQLNSNPSQFVFSDVSGAIVNTANLNLQPNQTLTLLGGQVINTGNITTPGGQVTIASVKGENLIRVTAPGSLLSIALPLDIKNQTHPQTITPASLPQLITGGNLGNATGITVQDGIVSLTGSNIRIPEQPGTTVVSNNIDVSGVAGGQINLLGHTVGLIDANLNAAGSKVGGQVKVGGDYQGQGPTPRSQNTLVNSNSRINVSAIESGNAGEAIIWSDSTTRFAGEVLATARSGNGGLVEVSGKENLQFNGAVDTSSASGLTGQLLLDPGTVTIQSAGAEDTRFPTNPPPPAPPNLLQEIGIDSSGGLDFSISPARIVTLMQSSDVAIAARERIFVRETIESGGNMRKSNLTLSAPRVDINSRIIIDDGNLSINTIDSINRSTDRITLNNAFIQTSNLSLQGNAIVITNSQILARQDLTATTATTLNLDNNQLQAYRDLTLQSAGNLTIPNGNSLLAGQDLKLTSLNGQLNINDIASGNFSDIRSLNNITLSAPTAIVINTLNSPQSIFRSGNNLNLLSNGPITGNGRFISGGNFVTQTLSGSPGDFRYNPVSSAGIVSAAGDITFGNYTGQSLKVEAGGSITAGDITIDAANTTLQGTDPDVALLSSSPTLILRAGLTPLRLTPNVLQSDTELRNNPNLLAGFSSSTITPSSKSTITTGNIQVNRPTTGADGVILSAPDGITTGTINTKGSNLQLTATTGNISVKTLNTQFGGSIKVNTKGLFRATDTFDFRYQNPISDFTTSPTSILTGTGAGRGSNIDGQVFDGNISITSGGQTFIENYATGTLPPTASGTAGLILRADGSNASLVPAYRDRIFLTNNGTVTDPNTGGNTGGDTGGNTGGNTGSGNTGGNTGTQTPNPDANSDRTTALCKATPTTDSKNTTRSGSSCTTQTPKPSDDSAILKILE